MVRAPSEIHIDIDALAANLTFLRKAFDPAMLSFVVKGNAYGHGLATVIPAALKAGQGHFATHSAREAAMVRKYAPGATIMVMGHVDPVDVPWLARQGIEIWVNRQATWDAVEAAASEGIGPLRLHFELETGMHRTGLQPEEALKMGAAAAEDPCMQWTGTCTHLAGVENRDSWPRVQTQVDRFEAFLDEAWEAGLDPGLRSVASSSAALMREDWRYDIVRSGIAAYGHWPTPTVREVSPVEFRPRSVLSWHSKIWSTQRVAAGASIGYGQHTTAEKDSEIAIVPVGYADGFARGLWEGGAVLVHGKAAPVVGMVNMNSIQVDVTGLSVQEGDPVVVIGQQGEMYRGIHSFAETYDMVNYELMARLAQHLPRKGVRSGQ